MGNLGDLNKNQISDLLCHMGIQPLNVRVLTDDTGRSKGAAFVDLRDQNDYNTALRLNGQTAPHSNRAMKVNPAAGGRPGGR